MINSNFITAYGIPKQTKSSNNNNVNKRSPYVWVIFGLMAYLWTYKISNVSHFIGWASKSLKYFVRFAASALTLLHIFPPKTASLSSILFHVFLDLPLFQAPWCSKTMGCYKMMFLLPLFCALHVSFQTSSYRFSVNLFCEPTHFLLHCL